MNEAKRTNIPCVFLPLGCNKLMTYELFNKLKIGQTDRCPCDTAPMTTQHLPQDCPLHDVLKQEAWPDYPPLRDRLYGNLEALRRTAAYVRGTGVSI